MATNAKHTQGTDTWNEWGFGEGIDNFSICKGDRVIARTPTPKEMQDRDACEFIKLACNSHDALPSALEECLTDDGATAERSHTLACKRLSAINDIVRAAIAQARGEA